jgi:hypothetical protein
VSADSTPVLESARLCLKSITSILSAPRCNACYDTFKPQSINPRHPLQYGKVHSCGQARQAPSFAEKGPPASISDKKTERELSAFPALSFRYVSQSKHKGTGVPLPQPRQTVSRFRYHVCSCGTSCGNRKPKMQSVVSGRMLKSRFFRLQSHNARVALQN